MNSTITLDEIRDREIRTHWIATTDEGGHFAIVAITPAGVIVRGERTEIHARVIPIGTRVRPDGQVRVRFEFARDTGDRDGTFIFDGTTAKGLAPAPAFRAVA